MKRLALPVAIIVALGALFAFGLLRGEPDRDIPSALLGRQAPAFTLPLYARYQPEFGASLNVVDHQGTPLLVNFWASWCLPCYDEAPLLQSFWEEYQDSGVLFVGVQTQDRQAHEEGRAFIDQFDLTFPNGMDDNSAVSLDWGLYGVPETYFVRRDGTVAYRHIGPVTAEVLERELTAILR